MLNVKGKKSDERSSKDLDLGDLKSNQMFLPTEPLDDEKRLMVINISSE